jgi:hypothetical protein
MTRLAVMQPYLFPYIGYFHLIHAVDRFVVLDDVSYIKGGWISRNRILVNGQPKSFTIPVRDASQNRPILAHERADDARWRARFLRTLELSYCKAPYFSAVFEIATIVLGHTEQRLSPWITMSLQRVCDYLSLSVEFVPTSSVYGNAQLSRQDRMVDICQREGATELVNAIGGTQLYSVAHFATVPIQLRFIHSRFTPYRHAHGGFVPALSILDVMMHNHPEEIREHLFTYDIK